MFLSLVFLFLLSSPLTSQAFNVSNREEVQVSSPDYTLPRTDLTGNFSQRQDDDSLACYVDCSKCRYDRITYSMTIFTECGYGRYTTTAVGTDGSKFDVITMTQSNYDLWKNGGSMYYLKDLSTFIEKCFTASLVVPADTYVTRIICDNAFYSCPINHTISCSPAQPSPPPHPSPAPFPSQKPYSPPPPPNQLQTPTIVVAVISLVLAVLFCLGFVSLAGYLLVKSYRAKKAKGFSLISTRDSDESPDLLSVEMEKSEE